MVNIFESLFILALDDEEGIIVESVEANLESILAGAVLAELIMQNRICLGDHRITVADPTPTGHRILDKTLQDMIDAGKPRKLKYWFNTLTYKKALEEVGQYLVEKGMLVRKKKHLHLVIPYGESPDGTVQSKYGLKNRLRDIVLAGQLPELTEKVLLAFLYHADMLKLVFTHGERKAAQKRVKKLVANDEEGSGLGDALDEILASACEQDL